MASEGYPVVWVKTTNFGSPWIDGTHYFDKEKKVHVIEVRPKVATSLKLHELGHAILQGDQGSAKTNSETAEREINADMWAYSKQGRQYGIKAFTGLVVRGTIESVDKPWTIKVTAYYKYFLNLAKSKGLTFSIADKKYLWNFIKDYLAHCKRSR